MTTKRSTRRLLTLALPALFLALAARAPAARAAAAAPVSPIVAAPAPTAPPVRQLADEIIRRLRRMGINIIKTRIDHPYDPDGEHC